MLTLNRKGRPFSFFLRLYTQDGGANPPDDLAYLETDMPGVDPTWVRSGVGDYMLSFPASSLSEDSVVAFVQIQTTNAAMYCNVEVTDGQDVRIIFRDQAGAPVEANCDFALMIFSYVQQIPA